MKKKIWARLSARPVLNIGLIILTIFLIIAAVSHWSSLSDRTNSLLNWATNSEPLMVIVAIIITYLGVFLKVLGANDKHGSFIKDTFWYKVSWPVSQLASKIVYRYDHWYDSWHQTTINKIKKISTFLIWCGVIIFTLNLFPLFNRWGLLTGLTIFLGATALISLELTILGNLPGRLNKALFFYIFCFFIIVLTYYLDYFIFGWNKPWFSGAAVIIAIASFLFLSIRNLKKWLNDKIRIRKQIKYQLRKERLEAEGIEQAIQDFSKRGKYQILLKYLQLKKCQSDQRAANLCLQAYARIKEKEEEKISHEELKSILKKIPFIDFGVDADFFRFLLTEMESNYSQEILLTHTAGPLADGELPILFRYCDNKKEVLEIISDLNNDVFYNDIKKEFKIKEFISLINAITYSYLKEWDDKQWLSITVNTLEHLIAFGVSCTEKVWSIDEAVKITSALKKVEENYKKKGVQVVFPKNFELIKEKFSEI